MPSLATWREMLPTLGIAMQGLSIAIVVMYIIGWLSSRATKGKVAGPWATLPLIGDTLSFMKSPAKYMWNNWVRYGGLFRTNLLGYPVYVVGAHAALRSIWSDDESFEFFVPGKTFTLLITDIRHLQEAAPHTMFRRKLSQALSPSALSSGLLPALTALMSRHLDSWQQQGRVALTAACGELSLDVALDVVTGHPLPPAPADKALVRNLFRTVLDGLYGIPLVLPGTAVYAALAARRKLMGLLWPLVEAEVAELTSRHEEQQRQQQQGAVEGAGGDGAAANGDGDSDGDQQGQEGQEGEGVMGAGQEASGGVRRRRRTGGVADAGGAPIRMLEAQISSAFPFRRQLSLTPEQVFERALGSVVAVDETSRHLFVALLGAVATAPNVKAKLEDEQREAMRKYGRDDLSYNVLNSLPYLDAVVKETLRLMPASIGGFRIAKRDVQLDGCAIPRGSIIFWSTHLAHSADPALLPRTPTLEGGGWLRKPAATASATAATHPTSSRMTAPLAAESLAGRRALARSLVGPTGLPTHMDCTARFEEAFRPERWLAEETRPRVFTGFGGGGHLCLGQHVALIEGKLLLSLLLRRFDFRLERPDMLSKCTFFPAPKPRKGTDGLILIPRTLDT